jgi:hypothetical protein
MSREVQSISKLSLMTVLLAFSVGLGGCTTASERLAKRLRPSEPVGRVYYAKYEEVEAALKQAMIRYPQRVDNTDAGIFETDYVKGEARFKSPQATDDFSSGYRYRVLIRMVRGRSTEKPAIRVLVTKQIELARDFFANPEQQGSDGLEESVILYRIGRELSIARAITKNVERANKSAR